jgi:hypothetical protein
MQGEVWLSLQRGPGDNYIWRTAAQPQERGERTAVCDLHGQDTQDHFIVPHASTHQCIILSALSEPRGTWWKAVFPIFTPSLPQCLWWDGASKQGSLGSRPGCRNYWSESSTAVVIDVNSTVGKDKVGFNLQIALSGLTWLNIREKVTQ